MKEKTIKYPGKTIDVYFTVDRCTHVAECVRGAPEVFDPARHPWIMADAAEPDTVAEVVLRCPTGALHFKRKDGKPEETVPNKNRAIICRDGPIYIQADFEIQNFDETFILKDTRIALCRCGKSEIMPLCDDSHSRTSFSDRTPLLKRKIQNNLNREKLIITLKKDGPFDLQGPVEITNPEGELFFKGNRILLCRCGRSQNMPFCDGSHVKTGFKIKKTIQLIHKKNDKTTY
ncbi:CDGSH iron-sulfur domain-containing protein [bacterium]|nr:CDGSH iron-sulfur domain-containing protein [bacterium]